MTPDLVIGVDSSTQSTKAIVWSASGEALAEGRAAIPMATPEPGQAEQDPRDWWRSTREALAVAAAGVDPARLAGLAISNQRETVALVDRDFEPLRPALVWMDRRGGGEMAEIEAALGVGRHHALTGKPRDLTPAVNRIKWLRNHEPERLDRGLALDVHAYLAGKLTGRATASWTSADPHGVFDIARKDWSPEIMTLLDLTPASFAALAAPGSQIGEVTARAAAETGLPEGLPVYAGGGDGQCAGLGVNACRPGAIYLNLGTALITGAWSAEPRIGRFWRTMTSPTGEGYFLEGCQRAGTYLTDWLAERFLGGRDRFAELEAEAAALPVGSEGLTVCPYLNGAMDPHWDTDATAAITGLQPHHGPAHLFRAALEAMTLESARCVASMRREGLEAETIVAVGGGAHNALWLRMYADATGLPVSVSRSLEASALGAGISAAVGAGLHPDFETAAAAMSRADPAAAPDPAARAAWDALERRQAAAYRPSNG